MRNSILVLVINGDKFICYSMFKFLSALNLTKFPKNLSIECYGYDAFK